MPRGGSFSSSWELKAKVATDYVGVPTAEFKLKFKLPLRGSCSVNSGEDTLKNMFFFGLLCS